MGSCASDGSEYVSSNATATTDRTCASVTPCGVGRYIAVPAGTFTDNSCGNCTRACDIEPVDIVFLVDGSASVEVEQYGGQAGNYLRGLQFLVDFVNELPEFGGDIRVGAITFSTTAEVQFNFSTFGSNRTGVTDTLLTLPYQGTAHVNRMCASTSVKYTCAVVH